MMILRLVDRLGSSALETCNTVGTFFIFFLASARTLFTSKLKVSKMFKQMERIGVNSSTIIFLTGSFTGMVLAMQSYYGFKRFGATEFVGTIVALSMTRELGPVLTGLMVTGRAGSAITAEIGTMRITEQIDALRTLGINPQQYLVVPRILASVVILPFLSLISMICGVVGGYFICTYVLGLNPEEYVSNIREYVELSDITGGLIKSSVFGLILSWVGTFKGYNTFGGARGVGKATTQSVVIGSIMILIANYFLTAILWD
ncbi:ABC transporter permease [Candidatus Babeliales bacterium]|nr:ABC transporter permease [Candidatus Babeliales bacterium]